MAASRYRNRHSVARKTSDAGDAFVLAKIVRTDLASQRCLPAHSELAQAVAVLPHIRPGVMPCAGLRSNRSRKNGDDTHW
jgi:hypothetical protein